MYIVITLTTSCFLVAAVLAVAFSIAQLYFCYALWCSVRTAARAQKFVIRTGNCCAICFIRFILTIVITVTMECCRDAQSVLTPELASVTRWEVWKVCCFFLFRLSKGERERRREWRKYIISNTYYIRWEHIYLSTNKIACIQNNSNI